MIAFKKEDPVLKRSNKILTGVENRLSEADMLEIPRRNIDEILDDLRTFRETGEVHFQGKFC